MQQEGCNKQIGSFLYFWFGDCNILYVGKGLELRVDSRATTNQRLVSRACELTISQIGIQQNSRNLGLKSQKTPKRSARHDRIRNRPAAQSRVNDVAVNPHAKCKQPYPSTFV